MKPLLNFPEDEKGSYAKNNNKKKYYGNIQVKLGLYNNHAHATQKN